MLFCCLWRNVETSCHEHFVLVFRHQQTPPLTTSDKCHNFPRSGGTVFITLGGRSVYSTVRCWSKIAIFTYPTYIQRPVRGGGFRRNIAMTFGMEKLEWCGYPKVKKFWRYVYSFWQNLRTWRTYGRRMTTEAALAYVSRGKNDRRRTATASNSRPITIT